MEDSMLQYNYHAKEGFTGTSKRKASLDMSNPAVINVDEDDEMECLACSFFPGAGAGLKRSCQSKNNVTHGSFEVLNGQKVCSDDQSEPEAKANGLKRSGIKEGSRHAPTKMQNEEEQTEAFKSLLAMEIKRQVLDGLGETGHSKVQDLQVMEIEDIVSSVGVSTNASNEEKNENNRPKPYIVKVKLLATVCIPIFLRTAPQSSLEEQALKQTSAREEVEEKHDSLLHSKEFPMCKFSQKLLEHPRSHVEPIKPHSMFKEHYNPQVLIETQVEAEEQKVSQVKYEKSFCRVPSSASMINVDDPATYSCNISNWRDRLDSDAGLLVWNDFEVHDFDADKSEDKFNEGQIWALYDDKDGMPRHYAQITEVLSLHPFEVSITWLEPKTDSMEALMWLSSGISITCGAFELRKQQEPIKLTHVHHFSHAMKSRARWKGENGGILISPSKGEVWALYKDQIVFHCASQRIGGKYELVQVVDEDRDSHTLTVVPLLKIAGFKTLFVHEQWPFKIAHRDFMKFSHQIPAYMLKDEPRAYLELDPASTPKLYD